MKYGSGYNLVQLEQAAAIIAINQGDGSVMVHQGGVEMGQGLATQVEQVTSYVLNVPMELIQSEGPAQASSPTPPAPALRPERRITAKPSSRPARSCARA